MGMMDELKEEDKKRHESGIWYELYCGRSKKQTRSMYEKIVERYNIDIEKIINEWEEK